MPYSSPQQRAAVHAQRSEFKKKILDQKPRKFIIHQHARFRAQKYEEWLKINEGKFPENISINQFEDLYKRGFIYLHIDLRMERYDKNELFDGVFFEANKPGMIGFPTDPNMTANFFQYVPHDPSWLKLNKPVDFFYNEKSKKNEYILTVATGLVHYLLTKSKEYNGKYNFYLKFETFNSAAPEKNEILKNFYYMHSTGSNAGRNSYKVGILYPKNSEKETKKSNIILDIFKSIGE